MEFPLFLLFLLQYFSRVSSSTLHVPTVLNIISQNHEKESSFDEQLYSRQIFVYGKSAQQQLLNAHVLVYGSGLLTAEILKNLALAGVGKISLIDDVNCIGPKSCLIGEEEDLLDYALSLNPKLSISRNISIDTLHEHNITVVVVADTSIPKMKRLNEITRQWNIKFISVMVRGVCGMIFDDFLDRHEVMDVDGETRKEVPLLSASIQKSPTFITASDTTTPAITSASTASSSLTVLVKVNCIEEDRFTDMGNGDVVEIILPNKKSGGSSSNNKVDSGSSSDDGDYKNIDGGDNILMATINSVVNPRTLILQLSSLSEAEILVSQLSSGTGASVTSGSEDSDSGGSVKTDTASNSNTDIIDNASGGGGGIVSLKKCAQTRSISHQSLNSILQHSSSHFSSSNGCSAPKKDKALSLTLLSAFLAIESQISPSPTTTGEIPVLKSTTTSNSSSSKSIKNLPSHSSSDRKKKLKHKSKKSKNIIDNDDTDDTNDNDASTSIKKKLQQQKIKQQLKTLALFRSQMISELMNMGVSKPLQPLKLGGSVGAEVIDGVADRFYTSTHSPHYSHDEYANQQSSQTQSSVSRMQQDQIQSESSYKSENHDSNSSNTSESDSGIMTEGVCAATVSVVGSVTAQEVIKAVTRVHMPVNQLLMFESLDSLHKFDDDIDEDNGSDSSSDADSDDLSDDYNTDGDGVSNTNINTINNDSNSNSNSKSNLVLSNAIKVYGKELAYELSRLKIFIVGAGAIGSELLKTLALMGVGTGCGSDNDSDGGSSDGENFKISSRRRRGTNDGDNDDEGNSSVYDNDDDDDSDDIYADEDSDSVWSSVKNGGIIITDMDSIERSNLNRQLLYRERHIGMSKATVAAEMIKNINPNMNIISLTNKICPETESIFNTEFWSHVDIVLPALDNIDARLYVDSLCVTHKKWLIDSGTLGTKGSTQVVIPGITESYSSSADPPDDAIPMCTLKSFPYQPEHCIAWARSLFDRLFNEEIRNLRAILEIFTTTTTVNIAERERQKKLTTLCDSLSPEAMLAIYQSLLSPQSTNIKSAIQWAITVFQEIYTKEVQLLLTEHPLEEKDEEGVPFWGGSRRVPSVIQFDPLNSHHRNFVLWAALLRYKACGGSIRSVDDPVIVSTYETVTHITHTTSDDKAVSITSTTTTLDKSQIQKSTKGKSQQQSASINDIKPVEGMKNKPSDIIRRLSIWKQQQAQSEVEEEEAVVIEEEEIVTTVAVGTADDIKITTTNTESLSTPLNLMDLSNVTVTTINPDLLSSVITTHIPVHERATRLNDLTPEEFEKDDASLGHVDFVTAASNLRSQVYGIRLADRLEVQRVAGKIVPAVATTTSLVAGLVCLELVKISSEKLHQRRMEKKKIQQSILYNAVDSDDDRTQKLEDINQPLETSMDYIIKYSKLIISVLSKLKQQQRQKHQQSQLDSNNSEHIVKQKEQEKERILQRFRNSFVNVARPLLAFSQPVPAESYTHGSHIFNMWDVIEVDVPVEELTVTDLEEFLHDNYDISSLQSLTYGDSLLYARFLPDAEFLSSLNVAQLLSRVSTTDISADDEEDNNDEINDEDEEESGDNLDVIESKSIEDSEVDDDDDDDESLTIDPLAEVFGDNDTEGGNNNSHNKIREYIDLTVACVDEEAEDIRLPIVRIRCTPWNNNNNKRGGGGGGKRSTGGNMNDETRKFLERKKQKSQSIGKKIQTQVSKWMKSIVKELPIRLS